MTQTECEKKVLLSKDEYRRVYGLFFEGQTPEKQSNSYYDTEDRAFQKKNVTVRIREKNGRYLGTVKTHSTDDPDCSVEDFFFIHEIPMSFDYEDTSLVHQGDLVTERLETKLDDQTFLVLDRNTYLGETDYELELEYPKEKSERAEGIMVLLRRILKRERPFERSLSKSDRFFQQLDIYRQEIEEGLFDAYGE